MLNLGLCVGIASLVVRVFPWIPVPALDVLQSRIASATMMNELTVVEKPLLCGETAGPFSANQFGGFLIPLDVDSDLHHLEITLSGGKGDADLYLRYMEPPEVHRYDRRPFVEGNEERIRVENPTSGRWFLAVHGFNDFQDVMVTLTCVHNPDVEEEVSYENLQEIELALYYELSGVDESRPGNDLLAHEILRQKGREAFEAGNFREAIRLWQRWSELDENDPRPVALVGDIYLRMGDVTEAMEWYQKSLQVHPGQIGLMTRLAKLLDTEAGKPVESRSMLNRYNRLFPDNSAVALAQAEWLLRRNRFSEADELIRQVIKQDPENLAARTLLHSLLVKQEDRFNNMKEILRIGQSPGREVQFAYSISDNQLLTRPESWVLMNFLEQQAVEAPTEDQRKLFQGLLPRSEITVEDFRIGRMSSNWISSRDQLWGEDGNLILSADISQTEAFLRLVRSDAIHNGFVEAEVEDTRGFFWIYARRGGGNMIRFGFEENGQLYLQVWMNDQLVSMQSRVWSRQAGPAVLRLEVRGDGAHGYVNGRSAFNTPSSIPHDMGLGWWGIAPWSPEFGTAKVSVRKIAGGPLPVKLGLVLDDPRSFIRRGPRTVSTSMMRTTFEMPEMKSYVHLLTSLAPQWYEQHVDGTVGVQPEVPDLKLRLLARYYRLRLLPVVRITHPYLLDLQQLQEQAVKDRLDGFTLIVDRTPDPEWLEKVEQTISVSSITLHVLQLDPVAKKGLLREFCPTVGLFPGARHPHPLPIYGQTQTVERTEGESEQSMILQFSDAGSRP